MELDYQHLMSGKTDEQLNVYLEKIDKYTPETIEYAVAELKQRGRPFSTEELADINAVIDAKRKETDKPLSANKWNRNVVVNIDAPAYYSERAIFMFSVLFSTVFGALLLANNVKRNGSTRNAALIIALFGIAYTTLTIVVLMNFPQSSGLTFAANAGGAFILNKLFWKKYIGEAKYRAKPIWIPLCIGFALTILLIIVIFNFGQ